MEMIILLTIKTIIRRILWKCSIHPIQLNDILPELGLSVTEAEKQLGVSRVTLSLLLNGKSAMSPEMATRIHQWLGKGPTPDVWLAMQAKYDLWQFQQKKKVLHVTPISHQYREVA